MKRLGIFILALTACEVGEPEWRTVDVVADEVSPGDADTSPEETSPSNPYAAPVSEQTEVIRRGRKVTLRLSWSKVEGEDVRYEAQVARVLTFSRMVAGGETAKTRLVARRLAPMIYYWRVRAKGKLGEGRWSRVQVADATAGPRGRAPPGTAPVATKEPPPPEPPEMRLVWREPLHRLVTTKSPVLVEGTASRGTQVQVGSREAIEVASTFSVPVDLAHGRNRIVLTGRLGDQEKSLQRVVYYADPGRLAPIRLRFEKLRDQLEEVNGLRQELMGTMKALEARLDSAEDDARVAEIRAEIARIAPLQREIDKEINSALSDLDRLLGG